MNLTYLRRCLVFLLVGAMLAIGCEQEKPPKPLENLPAITLAETEPYRTVRSLPLVANAEKYLSTSRVQVKGKFSPEKLKKPVTIVRAHIRFRKGDGTWVIANSAGSADVESGNYQVTIEAPRDVGAYELHVEVLDKVYIGRCEFNVIPPPEQDSV